MFLKTPSLTTHPIRALQRCSQPPRTVLIWLAGPHPSLRVTTSPAPPPTPAASPVWLRRMRQKPRRTTTLAWRVFHLLGRHISETRSPTAPGWKTVSAAPVIPVVEAPQGRANLIGGRRQTFVSNWNDHMISRQQTVSSTYLVVSWISIFSIPISHNPSGRRDKCRHSPWPVMRRKMMRKIRKKRESRWSLASLLLSEARVQHIQKPEGHWRGWRTESSQLLHSVVSFHFFSLPLHTSVACLYVFLPDPCFKVHVLSKRCDCFVCKRYHYDSVCLVEALVCWLYEVEQGKDSAIVLSVETVRRIAAAT